MEEGDRDGEGMSCWLGFAWTKLEEEGMGGCDEVREGSNPPAPSLQLRPNKLQPAAFYSSLIPVPS